MRSVILAANALALFCCVGLPHSAFADTVGGYIFNNKVFSQDSNQAPSMPSYYFFSIGATYQTPGDFSSATTTYPGPASPTPLPPAGPLSFNYNSPAFSTASELQTAFPFGDYTISLSGTGGSATNVVPYSADYFASSTPYLTNFASLSGLDPTKSFSVDFNSFAPDPKVSEGFTFFTIYNTAGNPVYDAGFQGPSTISDTIPANTLIANMQYSFQLDYSDRLSGFDNANTSFTEQGFDLRTLGGFQTGMASPNGAPAPLAGAGLLSFLGAGSIAIRKRAKRVITNLLTRKRALAC